MKAVRMPALETADLEQIKGYIVRLDRQLSVLMSGIGEEELSPALRGRIFDVADKRDIALRNEIIETAEQIRELSDRIELRLESEYVAKGQIGQYTEQAFQDIKVDGKGVTQYFEEIQQLSHRLDGSTEQLSGGVEAVKLEVRELKAYVRTGKLEDGVYGIEIGGGDGGAVPYKVRLSDNRLSFFVGGEEAAYFSDNSMYISRANVPLMLTVGSCAIRNDNGICFTAD